MSKLSYVDVMPGDKITIRYRSGTVVTGTLRRVDGYDDIENHPARINNANGLLPTIELIAHTPAPPAWDREGVEYVVDNDGDAWRRFDGDWICLSSEVVSSSWRIEYNYGPCRALVPEASA